MGNAWFVESHQKAATPNEEIDMIGQVDLSKTAVIGKDFEAGIGKISDAAGNADIVLTHYAPNELRYSYNSETERLAVFSEIYYPAGWKAWIEPAGAYGKVEGGRYQPTSEAKPLELLRVNWILRAAVLPAGESEIVMRFEPQSYKVGADISRACSITLIILLLLAAAGMIYSQKRQTSM